MPTRLSFRTALLALLFTPALAGCGAGAPTDTGDPASATESSASVAAPPSKTTGEAATASSPDAPARWRPGSAAPIHFHWQLSTTFVYPRDVVKSAAPVVYDLDGETTPASVVTQLHSLGAKVVCYVDVGTWEKFRSDASSFPAADLGKSNGWPGEKWLDVRDQANLLPIMKARFQNWCIAKGFDAVEPDNLDGWQNKSGFPLTRAENLSYDTAIAAMVHSLGLSVGLKNLPQQAPSLVNDFDWALDEQCWQYSECGPLESSFAAAGKAVFEVEYSQAPNCTGAVASHVNSQRRDLELVGPTKAAYVYSPCVPDEQTTW